MKKGDHRDNSAVITAGLQQIQLHEDAAHVDSTVDDPQLMRNTRRYSTLGHQRQHLALPCTEHRQRIAAPAG